MVITKISRMHEILSELMENISEDDKELVDEALGLVNDLASEANDIHNVSDLFCCGQNRVYNEPKCSKQCDDCYSEYNAR